MLPTAQSADSLGSGNRQRDTEMASARDAARTPSASVDAMRATDRKKVLERARRMLAVALEEERNKAQLEKKVEKVSPRVTDCRPGCGAWWLF